MRSAIVILTLCAVALAQESAAELFYKAFWLEQAEGKTAEATELYERILAEHPDAQETPRVLLGLARLDKDNSTQWLDRLRAAFPESEEAKAAEKLVPWKRERFKVDSNAASAVDRKLSQIYTSAHSGQIQQADTELLVELGLQAQPMLKELLFTSHFLPVLQGARVLMSQRLASSERILLAALGDNEVLYKNAIVMAFAEKPCVSEELVDAMIAYCGRTRSKRKRDIVMALANQLKWSTPGHESIFRFLTDRILTGSEEEKGYAASARPRNSNEIPDAYLDAILRNAKWALLPGLDSLVVCADRPGIGRRTLMSVNTLLKFDSHVELRDMSQRPASLRLMADIGLAFRDRLVASNPNRLVVVTLGQAVRYSPEIATEALKISLEEDNQTLAFIVTSQAAAGNDPQGSLVALLGEANTNALRRYALSAVYESGGVGNRILGTVGLTPDDLDMAIEVHEAHPNVTAEMPIFDEEFVIKVGPEGAKRLAEVCRGAQRRQLLESSMRFEDLSYFELLVPKVGTESLRSLTSLSQRGPAWAEMIARYLLDQKGEEWRWTRPGRERYRGNAAWRQLWGSQVRDALTGAKLRGQLFQCVTDDRLELAELALRVVIEEGDQAALTRALESPFPDSRAVAVSRIEDPKVLMAFLQRTDIERREIGKALDRLSEVGDESVGDFLFGRVRTGKEEAASEWFTWHKLQPRASAHYALKAFDDPESSKGFRALALEILTRVDLPQRIDVFRSVLAGHVEGDVGLILRTVRDQYLVELGVETLGYLRSPDKELRGYATEAIERIKFYAEAKRALETQPVIPANPPRSR